MTADQKEKVRAAKRAYKREWCRTHPENVRAAQERYWLKKADEIQQRESAAD